MADYFDRHAAHFKSVYGFSRDFKARFAVWTGLIDRCLAAGPVRACVDVGCGAGLFSFYTAQKGIPTTGVDISEQMLSVCRAEQAKSAAPGLTFAQGRLPLPADHGLGTADLVLCSSVLEYVRPLDEAVASLADLLKPGGHLIVSLPNAWGVYRRYEALRFKATGRPEYYRHVVNVLGTASAKALFARHGLLWRDTVYYGDEPFLSRAASAVLPAVFSKNLYALMLQKAARA